jgi:hypothetical protein
MNDNPNRKLILAAWEEDGLFGAAYAKENDPNGHILGMIIIKISNDYPDIKELVLDIASHFTEENIKPFKDILNEKD